MTLIRLFGAMLVSLALLPNAIAQTATMKIHLRDGSEQVVGIDAVKKLSFSFGSRGISSVIGFHQHWDGGQPNNGDYYFTRWKLNLHFGKNEVGERVIFVEDREYRLLTAIKPGEQQTAPLDSITLLQTYADTNITLFNGSIPISGRPSFSSSIWVRDTIYVTSPLLQIPLDSGSTFQDSASLLLYTNALSISPHPSGQKLLFIESKYSNVSCGSLNEYDIVTRKIRIIDSTRRISCAHYLDDGSIVYYDYGSYEEGNNEMPADAGYYRIDPNNIKRELLLPRISTLGPSEGINGFDVVPDGSKLLIPIVEEGQPPIIAEIVVSSKRLDTLAIPFEDILRECLWLRYDHTGSRILYDNYPAGVITYGYAKTNAEVGIFDRSTLQKKVLSIVPEDNQSWMCLFPAWSTDKRKISFSASPIQKDMDNFVGTYRLYLFNLP